MKTTAELQKELNDLFIEKADCENKVKDGEKAAIRLEELKGGWYKLGELTLKLQEVEDSKYPVFNSSGFKLERIVDIDDKWIHLKVDGCNININRYKRDTGWRARARSGDYAIDAEKALKIWDEFKNEH